MNIIDLFDSGEPIKKIADRLGVSYGTARKRLIDAGVQMRSRSNKIGQSNFDRFMKRVKHGLKKEDCWEWIGSKDKHGYGRFWICGEKTTAQRASYRMFIGDFPNHYQIDHICRNPSCVNPKHLQAITVKENLALRILTKTVCRKGHMFTPETTMIETVNGKTVRRCKICRTKSRKEKK